MIPLLLLTDGLVLARLYFIGTFVVDACCLPIEFLDNKWKRRLYAAELLPSGVFLLVMLRGAFAT